MQAPSAGWAGSKASTCKKDEKKRASAVSASQPACSRPSYQECMWRRLRSCSKRGSLPGCSKPLSGTAAAERTGGVREECQLALGVLCRVPAGVAAAGCGRQTSPNLLPHLELGVKLVSCLALHAVDSAKRRDGAGMVESGVDECGRQLEGPECGPGGAAAGGGWPRVAPSGRQVLTRRRARSWGLHWLLRR